MKKKKIIVILIIAIVSIFVKERLIPSYSYIMDMNWNISLPVEAWCTEIYEKDSGSSFHGDGTRYHVFSYRNESSIDLMFEWSANSEEETIFHSSVLEAATAWLDEIEVPETERPNYEECFVWYTSKEDHSEVVFFWNPEVDRIYVVESFF